MDVTATTASASAAATGYARPTAAVSSDFETFLKMLTVQMQNQDPLNPMEASDFAVQLATFSGVEQQVQTNQLLSGMSSQIGMLGLSQFAGWVGMEVRAPVPAYFGGDPITLAPEIPDAADRATLVVRNAMGTEVERRDIPLSGDPIQWAGFSEAGTPLPAGHYSFELISHEGDKFLSTDPVLTYSRVVETRAEGGQVMLVLQGGGRVPADRVSGLRQPG